jgi:hypothetical protein
MHVLKDRIDCDLKKKKKREKREGNGDISEEIKTKEVKGRCVY